MTAGGSIDGFIDGLGGESAAILRELRRIVLSIDPRVGEEIKWNSPSFFLTGHFATTSARPGRPVLLVLHAGAKKRESDLTPSIPDPWGVLEWKSADRAIMTFDASESVRAVEPELRAILTAWIAATQ